MEIKDIISKVKKIRKQYYLKSKSSSYSMGPFSSLSKSSGGILFKGQNPTKRFNILIRYDNSNLKPQISNIKRSLYNGKTDICLKNINKPYKNIQHHIVITFKDSEVYLEDI